MGTVLNLLHIPPCNSFHNALQLFGSCRVESQKSKIAYGKNFHSYYHLMVTLKYLTKNLSKNRPLNLSEFSGSTFEKGPPPSLRLVPTLPKMDVAGLMDGKTCG